MSLKHSSHFIRYRTVQFLDLSLATEDLRNRFNSSLQLLTFQKLCNLIKRLLCIKFINLVAITLHTVMDPHRMHWCA